MKKRKRTETKNSIKLAVLFFACVFTILLISFLIKGIIMVRESIYDSSYRFNLKVASTKSVEVLSFSKASGSITVLEIEDGSQGLNISYLFGIPIDGFLEAPFLNRSNGIPTLLSKALLSYPAVKTNLTVLDMVRLFLFSLSVPSNSIGVKSLSSDLGSADIDEQLGRSFNDEHLAKESSTIEIVNGTDIAGLGNRLARLITNMGGNVVSVKTADALQNQSLISFIGKKNYTVMRLATLLKFRTAQIGDKGLADIVIVVGQDNQTLLF